MWIHMMPKTRRRVGVTEVSWIGGLRHLKWRLVLLLRMVLLLKA
jgi:hypothetical protein